MKVLAFVDSHGWFDILDSIHEKVVKENIELVLCAGDVSVFSRDIKLILDRMNELGCKVLLIPGNHEEPSHLEKLCRDYENIIYLHQGSYVWGNYFFFGYGGGGFSKRDERFARIAKKVEKDIEDGMKLVLLLHGPPYGTKLDLVMDDHVGNQDYTDFIKRAKPELVVCGHLHENSEKQDRIGNSKIINPGPDGKVLDI